MMKKIFSLLLTASITILLFTSCFNINPESNDNPQTEYELEYIALNDEEVRETDIIAELGTNVG
ncbi:MAG: hypothetical protein FXF54_13855, partial [Kosmotoga sp.]